MAFVNSSDAELAGNAERHRQVEMADPQAIDPGDAAMASAFSTPSAVSIWQKSVRAPVGRGEFLGDSPRPVAVMGHLKRDAAPAVGRDTSWN